MRKSCYKTQQANLANKSDIANLVNMRDFNDKLKKINKKLLQINQNVYFLKMN